MKLNHAKLIDLCFKDCSGQYGVPYSAEEYDTSKYRYLRISDITDDGFLHNNDLKSVSGDNLEAYLLKENDIVFARTGNSTGRSYMYDIRDGKLVYAGFLIKYSINPQKINPKYVRYFTQSSYYKQWVKNLSNGSTRGNINAQTFADCDIFFPERCQQDILVNELDSINDKIALNTRMNAELEAMAKQLYDYWFVQFDFPFDFAQGKPDENGKPYKSSGGKMVWNEKLKREIPEGWGLESISNILDKVVTTPRLITDEYLKFGNYPIIDQTTDVYYAGFTNREDAVSYQYPTVIFGDHSCAVKYVNFPFVRGADGTQVMLSKNKNVSIEYLYFVVKQIKVSKGYARHYGFIKDSLIIIPSHAISLKFKDIVELLFTQITKNRKDMVYLTQLRDSLLPMLMNGQVTIE